MELHDKGKFICKILQLVPSTKTKKLEQLGSSTPLEVHKLFNLVIPNDSRVVPYLGAKFSIVSDEKPEQPAQSIQVNSVVRSDCGDVLEIEML